MTNQTQAEIEVWIPGVPKPQGSMRLVNRRTGKIIHSASLIQWRTACVMLLRSARKGRRLEGPVELSVTFVFVRPGSHAKRIAEADGGWRDRGSDLDKLIRAVGDALTISECIRDDTQIAAIHAAKIYGVKPGARVLLRSLTGVAPPA